MADHEEVFQKINKKAGVSYPVLTPNIQGFEKYELKNSIILFVILCSFPSELLNVVQKKWLCLLPQANTSAKKTLIVQSQKVSRDLSLLWKLHRNKV